MAMVELMTMEEGEFDELEGGPAGRTYEISLNDAAANGRKGYPSNYIQTAKYTIWSFVPINLFEQFRRFSNFYFLLNALFSLIPDISPIGPLTSVTPLVFVLVVAAVKDAYEDYQRHKADKRANSEEYRVIRDGEQMRLQSQAIISGDIVIVEEDRQFPADMVLLASPLDAGAAFIMTMNLDGETSLKSRLACAATDSVRSTDLLTGLHGVISCHEPNEVLESFEGRIDWHRGSTIRTEVATSLSGVNLLLRGSSLKNTPWIAGVVVYAGPDTKMFQNLKLSFSKFSLLEGRLNQTVVGMFALNVVILLACAVGAGIFHGSTGVRLPFMGNIVEEAAAAVAGVHILTYFILFTYLIPISLFVTIELVRLAQTKFMEWDEQMVSTDDEMPMQARNSHMNEELSMVEHIFTDKTGTLTRNIMVLFSWSINGTIYDHQADPGALAAVVRDPDHIDHEKVLEFLITIALCNTVVPTQKPLVPPPSPSTPGTPMGETPLSGRSRASQGSRARIERSDDLLDGIDTEGIPAWALRSDAYGIPQRLLYSAQSPDEKALVEAAADCGVVLLDRSNKMIKIEVNGEEQTYDLLHTLAFSSARKRMSVIVRDPAGAVRLLVKGADDVMIERAGVDEAVNIDFADAHARDFAKLGLRTLVVGASVLDEEYYETWSAVYERAWTSIDNREVFLEEAENTIEVDVAILGVTAVEDKLQDEVPASIEWLLAAGMSVWLLTGDKQETAENIGYSSSLLDETTELIRLNAGDSELTGQLIDMYLGQYAFSDANLGLIVDGYTLAFIMADHTRTFLQLGRRCQSVICCRVNALQKKRVVDLVRRDLGRVTLAIGDGANDVSMIQTANVGIGISGKEGTQAVRASDFALGEFRFLVRLLAVHGRYSFIRLAGLIQFSFYKNLVLALPQFYFSFLSGWSGQTVYEEVLLSSFNIIWTAAPPLVMGMLEKDVREHVCLEYPTLYNTLKGRDIFTRKSFFGWLGLALFHSLVVFWGVTYGVIRCGQIYADGSTVGLWTMGAMLSLCTTTVVLFKAATYHRMWTWITHFIIWGSLLGFLLFAFLYSLIPPTSGFNPRLTGVVSRLYASPVLYLTMVVILVVCLLPDFVWKIYNEWMHPQDWHILRERDKKSMPSVARRPAELISDIRRKEKIAASASVSNWEGGHDAMGGSGRLSIPGVGSGEDLASNNPSSSLSITAGNAGGASGAGGAAIDGGGGGGGDTQAGTGSKLLDSHPPVSGAMRRSHLGDLETPFGPPVIAVVAATESVGVASSVDAKGSLEELTDADLENASAHTSRVGSPDTVGSPVASARRSRSRSRGHIRQLSGGSGSANGDGDAGEGAGASSPKSSGRSTRSSRRSSGQRS